MAKNINEIIKESDDLHFIRIEKPNKRDKSSWTFTVTDKTSLISGLSDNLSNYKYKIVTLRRGNHFFLAYKIYFDNTFEYFIDTRKANHKKSVSQFVNGLVNYFVFSNDISKMKNDPSFKITELEMRNNGIDNFIDLCVYFGDYSAIGTGYTRNIRNLLVMDIDVDCTKEDNKNEINSLLVKFSECMALPDFYIFNHESNHVQLQWLIRDCDYKIIDTELIDATKEELSDDTNRNCEIKFMRKSFTKLSRCGEDYRTFTLSLTDIVNKRKFGDKNYTFWKAKNFYTAFLGLYNLELKMPYLKNGEICFRTHDEMEYIFSDKKRRDEYFNMSPTISSLYEKMKPLVKDLIDKNKKTYSRKLSKIKDVDEIVVEELSDRNRNLLGASRNNFVLKCTRETTWEYARKHNINSSNDVKNLESGELEKFKKDVKRIVKKKFKDENDKYNGIWPDTTNHTEYSRYEFDSTFNNSFLFAIQNISNDYWSKDQRKNSIETRHLTKEVNLTLVDSIRNNRKNIKRTELLNLVNAILKNSGRKEISMTSLKRYISESKKLNKDTRKILYNNIVKIFNENVSKLNEALKTDDKKTINSCRKKCDRININIINHIISEIG